MEKTALQMLADIAVKSLESLTNDEIAFLKARRSYLNGDQAAKFASILDGGVAAEEPAEEVESASAKRRKKIQKES